MKKIVLLFAVLFCVLTVVGCSGGNPSRPETDLEFWICDNVDGFDFSGYQQKFGLMGGREYYGTGYAPTINENGEQVDPEYCVVYTVTSYPDYSSGKMHITGITITDPAVELYGITLNSSIGEVHSAMEANGFKQKSSHGTTYVNGKVSIRFSDDCIRISAEVTNLWGIQF